MAAVIHHFLLNKLNSQNCKAERIHFVDYFIKYKQRKKLHEGKGGIQFYLELKGKEK